MATPRIMKIRNIHRITVTQWAKAEGYRNDQEAMEDYAGQPGLPALCSNGCWVAPGQDCQHGNPAPKAN